MDLEENNRHESNTDINDNNYSDLELSPLTKAEKNWISFNGASLPYFFVSANILFPLYYYTLSGKGQALRYGVALTISLLISALLTPVVGVLTNHIEYRKLTLVSLFSFGLLFVILSVVINHFFTSLVLYCLSFICMTLTQIIYSYFLTNVTTALRLNKVSSYSQALGFLSCAVLCAIFIALIYIEGSLLGAIRYSSILISIWNLVFCIPFLMHQDDDRRIFPIEKKKIEIIQSIKNSFASIKNNKSLLLFFIPSSFMFGGILAIVLFSLYLGLLLNISAINLIINLLIFIMSSLASSLIIGKLSNKITTVRLFMIISILSLLISSVGSYFFNSLSNAKNTLESKIRSEAVIYLDNYEPSHKAKEGGFRAIVFDRQDNIADIVFDAGVMESSDDKSEYFANEIRALTESYPEYYGEIFRVSLRLRPIIFESTEIKNFYAIRQQTQNIFLISSIIFGIVCGVFFSLMRAFVLKFADKEDLGGTLGALNSVWLSTAAVSSLIFSILSINNSESSTTIVLIVVFLISFILLTVSQRFLSNEEKYIISRL